MVEQGQLKEHQANRGFAMLYDSIKEANADPRSRKTRSKCKKSGDVIIALEAPGDTTLLTFDGSFEALCGILGKRVHKIPSLHVLRSAASN